MRQIASLVVLFISFQNLDCQSHGKMISQRQSFFDIELLGVAAAQKRGNVMVSPASIKSTLAMILAGAEGDTAREIVDALRLPSERKEIIEQIYQYLAGLQVNTTTVDLQNANGIFVSDKLNLSRKYESLVKLEYQSEVKAVDFTDPVATAGIINKWVSERTHGLIPFVVEPIHVSHPNDLILANALYFKSTWHYAFNRQKTRSSCFFHDAECKMVSMMDLETSLNYAHVVDLRAHAVELPYVGDRYSMLLLVPLMKDGIEGLIRDLSHVGFQKIFELMHPTTVALSMPRFTVNYNEDLVGALRNLHITSLFSTKANLSKIFEGSTHQVNSFHHKVFMSVDEAGTVAAASSVAAVVPLIFDGSVQVRADRPFLFFIRDNELGIVLFEGKIEVPSVMENAPVIPSGEIPIEIPIVESRREVPTVQSGITQPTTKSTGILESFRNLFG